MNGAETIFETAASAGLDICFANPGTTELPLVSALDRVRSIRPVLCLAEAVCAGAADGYGRMKGKAALTLLHLGPGLANGLAYFHNARRAATPIVNLIGNHASWHLAADAPLTSDIEALARPMSVWVKSGSSAESLASDTIEAIYHSAGGVASLIVPSDYQAGHVSTQKASPIRRAIQSVSESDVQAAAKILRSGKPTALLLGGAGLTDRGLRAAARIRTASECNLIHETFPARIERGGDLPDVMGLPYMPTPARQALGDFATIILAGTREPVSFFGYEGQPSSLVPPGTEAVVLAPAPQDAYFDTVGALEYLADVLDEKQCSGAVSERRSRSELPTGALNPESFATTIAAMQPEDGIVVDESVTSGFSYNQASLNSPRHTCLVPHVGGAIGHGLPVATGAALASPDRSVILLEADGSGMYTLQSLWTQAREQLNVTTVICANRKYRILQLELGDEQNVKQNSASDLLLRIDQPSLDWVQLSIGLGVPSQRVEMADELAVTLKNALDEPGPHLIEALL
ncbi:MAG: acetolactate synthase large subunit [Candidatus Dormibacteraceae bacterium]